MDYLFNLSTSHLIQLLVALIGGISLFVFAFVGFQRQIFKGVIVTLPFQFVDSRFGSLNMAVIYVLGMGMILNKSWIKKKTNENWPLIGPFFIIALAFTLSAIVAPKMFRSKNLFYIIMLGSNVLLFYMSYHFVSDEDDIKTFFKLFFICNLLVILYCILQLAAGFGDMSLFGIKELSIKHNRTDNRLVGPFNAVGITAEYLVIQCLLFGYFITMLDQYKKAAIMAVFCNLAILIGTGNRGGFLSIILATFMFFFVFRKNLGAKKILLMALTLFITLVLASFFMIRYTQFNVLYERLLATEMDGITPDTRSYVWADIGERIFEKPVLGHGPRLVTTSDMEKKSDLPKGEIGYYPHSLYLTILYTTGIVGFVAFSIWAVFYLILIINQKKRFYSCEDFISGLPRLALIFFFIILFDQLKVEFMRHYLVDYQNYLCALFGMFCALKKIPVNHCRNSGGE